MKGGRVSRFVRTTMASVDMCARPRQITTLLKAILDSLLDEVPRARESGNVIGVARANAVARWLIHVACFSGFEELHDAIVDIAQVRCPR